MNKRLLLTAFAMISALAGCANDPCSRNSPCPNDTPPTQSERDQCRATLNANSSSACYSEVVAYYNCSLDNVVCGGTGMTDPVLSATRTQNNCVNQLANVTACCTRNPSATACH